MREREREEWERQWSERDRGARETEEQVKQRSKRDRVTEEEGHAHEQVTEES